WTTGRQEPATCGPRCSWRWASAQHHGSLGATNKAPSASFV
ncbi:MAG: hypothetical protein AVDCRST_MAG51-253, partial [uncultured Ramlibacter sp.]